MDIPILYEDEHMIAINKPAGLVVHSDGRTTEATLADWVIEKYPDTKEVGEPITQASGEIIYRPGIVHRLDRDTSGVLLIAKTAAGFECLKDQFKERDIQKTYNAFVYGIVKEKEGTIDRPISRSRKDFRLWSAQRGGRGEEREAVTKYKVLKELEGEEDKNGKKQLNKEGDVSFVEVMPLTGRTHQIRVHFKAINHPVVGDILYAPKKEALLGFTRLALHARKIVFHNFDREEIHIEAPLPEDFEVALSYFM